MPNQPQPETRTAPDILGDVGRSIFDGDDWPSRLAVALNVRRDTIRKWMHGRLPLGADHSVFDDLLALVTRRAAELRHARKHLQQCLAATPPAGPDPPACDLIPPAS